MVTRTHSIRELRRRACAGVSLTAIVTILSACSAMQEKDEPLVASAGATGQPWSLQWNTLTGLGEAGATSLPTEGRVAGAPLQLIGRVDKDWVDQVSEVAEGGGPPAVPRAVSGEDGVNGTALTRTVEQSADLPLRPLPLLLSGQRDKVVDDPAIALEPEPPELLVDGRLRDPMIAERPVGEPLQLVMVHRPDWVETWQDLPAVDERLVGAPPQSLMSAATDRLANRRNEPVVAAVHIGAPFYPLILSDGSYHWPENAGATIPAADPCRVADAATPVAGNCGASDAQIALAETVIDDAALSELRGGFVTVGGFQIDFGFYVETLVDGVTELTSALTLDSMLAGESAGGVTVVDSALIAGAGDTVTSVEHVLSASEIGATIANTQSDINITNVVTLAIDVIDLRQVQTGTNGSGMPRMPLELQQSIIRGIAR